MILTRIKSERGQAFVLAAVAMVMCMGMAALVLDVGNWFRDKRRLQGTADAAALAGAQMLPDDVSGAQSQALSYAMMLAFFRNEMGFGGNNGFTDFKEIAGFDLHRDGTRVALFVVTAVSLAAAYLACRLIASSRAGRVIRAIRDAESRTRFLGYHVESYKLWVFVFSAVIAGVAGALYVPQVGIINPSELQPSNSIEMAIWVAVGGRGTLIGPIIGAFAVNGAKSVFTAHFPEYWLFFLGLIFVLVPLLLPNGIMGLIELVTRRSNGR